MNWKWLSILGFSICKTYVLVLPLGFAIFGEFFRFALDKIAVI